MITDRTSLSRHGRPVTSVLDLLGTDKNDLTAALGFTLARSPELLARLARLLLPPGGGAVSQQMETRDELGRTDLELHADGHLVVIEAKKGWLLPHTSQLAAYAPRVTAAGGGTLVPLSEASTAWAANALAGQVAGVPVSHAPWSQVRSELTADRTAARGEQRHWLDEL